MLRRLGTIRRKKKVKEVEEEADAAFDVSDYFVDDVADPWTEGDALERERLSQHAALREAVCRGDAAATRDALAALGPAAGLVVNLTPQGANTLLYVSMGGARGRGGARRAGAGRRARRQPHPAGR
ncbi:hypothetical protein MSG28_014856 [Choristoneura fumiferana]|uniref:Uncharacterized protein n=1 Tax=Choristoneura fumiferana TaxID=7141 RepID=A0ACC0JT31_CHOFU|nr:hypothetical protein MSG28_014856 [Choristoneura fumiferana]